MVPKAKTAKIVRNIVDVLATVRGQGLTLVHFSAQLEPCLSHKPTLHTLNTP